MAFPVVILPSAKDDFREIKHYVKKMHGQAVWADVNQQFKGVLNDIGKYPVARLITEEARALGLDDIRQRLVGQTRVIYQFDGSRVYMHMFASTLRDFMTLLTHRLLKGI